MIRSSAENFAKRSFDLLFGSVGLCLSAPLWVIIALAIKNEDGGPIFFAQPRVGRHGRQFKSWKFRSMTASSEVPAHIVQATHHDPRITRVGGILRATAMDELPQLWNIVRGDMSVVGPRALVPSEAEVHGSSRLVSLADIPGYHARHQVAPGLTGIAQIYADRDIPRRHKFRYDLLYVRRRSFLLDLRLIALSFWITARGKWEQRGGKLNKPLKARPVKARIA